MKLKVLCYVFISGILVIIVELRNQHLYCVCPNSLCFFVGKQTILYREVAMIEIFPRIKYTFTSLFYTVKDKKTPAIILRLEEKH